MPPLLQLSLLHALRGTTSEVLLLSHLLLLGLRRRRRRCHVLRDVLMHTVDPQLRSQPLACHKGAWR